MKAIWNCNGHDHHVTIISYLGEVDGREYVSIEGSKTGVPLDELRDPDNKYVGFWVDSHGRVNTTE